MTKQSLPQGFLWGVATAGHQVEGNNRNSNWWHYERAHPARVAEPSARACDHYARYREDLALIAALGVDTYRYSIEWSRIETAPGVYDEAALAHYIAVTEAVLEAGLTPFVTLNHFTIPQWLAEQGSWLAPDAGRRFADYTERVTAALGERVAWYATLNEPGNVAFGGYLGALGWPPGLHSVRSWLRSIEALIGAHHLARDAVRSAAPHARVGSTHAVQQWTYNPAAAPAVQWISRHMEDVFVEAASGDDWVGVQTYMNITTRFAKPLGPLVKLAFAVPALRDIAVPLAVNHQAGALGHPKDDGLRRTQMGYEYDPEAIGAALRHVAKLLPGTQLIVTEHGVATAVDAERIEYIDRGIAEITRCVAEGVPVRGYIHWSALDNFEWAVGYAPTFGVIGVDRLTLERTPRPSGYHLGRLARGDL